MTNPTAKPDANGWMDIASAPRDGTEILARFTQPRIPAVMVVVSWNEDHWEAISRIWFGADVSGVYQPLPAPPPEGDTA